MPYKKIGDVGALEAFDNEAWKACREHGTKLQNGLPVLPVEPAKPGDEGYIPFTLGGSSIAAAIGKSPYTNPRELYEQKLGHVERKGIDPFLADRGHIFEDAIAKWFLREANIMFAEDAKKYGKNVTLINDTNLYQNTDYPWFLGDTDRLFILPDGRRGLLEVKSATNGLTAKQSWASGILGSTDPNVPAGKAPEHYVIRTRAYSNTLDVDLACLICLWDFSQTGFALVWIPRDTQAEHEIFEAANDFIKRLEKQDPPSVAKVESVKAEDLLDTLTSLYNKDEHAVPVTFSQNTLSDLQALSDVSARLQQVSKEVRELEKERDRLLIPFVESIGDAPGGSLTGPDGSVYSVKMDTGTTTRVSTTLIKERYPEIAKECTVTSARKPKFTYTPPPKP